MEDLETTLWIGKRGLTQETVNEMLKQFDKREYVKVKLLKSAISGRDVKEIAKELANLTGSKTIDVRGHTITLYKPKTQEPAKKSL